MAPPTLFQSFQKFRTSKQQFSKLFRQHLKGLTSVLRNPLLTRRHAFAKISLKDLQEIFNRVSGKLEFSRKKIKEGRWRLQSLLAVSHIHCHVSKVFFERFYLCVRAMRNICKKNFIMQFLRVRAMEKICKKNLINQQNISFPWRTTFTHHKGG